MLISVVAHKHFDDLRLVGLLLANTMLKVRVEGELLVFAVFESLLGSFQCDSLSGKLFTLVLAGALVDFRQRLAESPPHIPNPSYISKDQKERPWPESAYSDRRALTTVIS